MSTRCLKRAGLFLGLLVLASVAVGPAAPAQSVGSTSCGHWAALTPGRNDRISVEIKDDESRATVRDSPTSRIRPAPWMWAGTHSS